MPGMTSAPRNDRRDFELGNCLHETGADCETIGTESGRGIYHLGPSDGRRLPNGSLSPTAKGRGGRNRRDDGRRIQSQPGGANHRPASTACDRTIPRATGAAGVDTQGRRGPATAGHPGAGGQDRATGGGDDTGGDLRAAFLRVLMWLSASFQRARGDYLPAAAVSG